VAGTVAGGSAAPPTNGPVCFNLGLQGTSTQLSLYISKVPSEAFWNFGSGQPAPVMSDLRRVDYWLARASGAPPLGLARQELKVVTTQDALNIFDPGAVDEKQFVISEDVVGLTFQYFDGTEWWDSWDGTVLQSDGQTPQGPPMAVAITLSVR